MRHRICWIGWIAGSALIFLSWWRIVTPTVGGAGFAVACVASLVSYLPMPSSQRQAGDWTFVTRAMLDARDHGYAVAMERLKQGGLIFYEGMAILVRSEREIACAVAASRPADEVDEVRALADAERTKGEFDRLAWLSPEFAAIAAGRTLRISLVSEFGDRGYEIAQIAEGKLDWSIRGK